MGFNGKLILDNNVKFGISDAAEIIDGEYIEIEGIFNGENDLYLGYVKMTFNMTRIKLYQFEKHGIVSIIVKDGKEVI